MGTGKVNISQAGAVPDSGAQTPSWKGTAQGWTKQSTLEASIHLALPSDQKRSENPTCFARKKKKKSTL